MIYLDILRGVPAIKKYAHGRITHMHKEKRSDFQLTINTLLQ